MPAPLPFVVAPKQQTRIVEAEINGEICSLEFPVFGCITSNEDIAIREHEYQAAVYRESSRLADALVADGTEETEAQRIAIRILSTRMGVPVPLDAPEQRAMLRHAALIADLQTTLGTEYKRLILRKAHAAIVYRLAGCQDWTEADAGRLPTPLREAIAAFIDSEQNAKTPDRSPEELVDEMVETLGKLAPPASQDSPDPQLTLLDSSHNPSTGEQHSGNAASSGHTPQSSAANPSDNSPSPTSSRRSKKANAA